MTAEPKRKWSPEEQAEIDRLIADSTAKTNALIAESNRLIAQGEALKECVRRGIVEPSLKMLFVAEYLRAHLDREEQR
ncbi:MAG: hypothetical protein ACYC2H_07270 [Thermoplasmatota archaeon]